MRVRAITATGDWTFGAGQNNYKTGKNAVAQSIQTRLSSFLGDCFFDLGAGIDWLNFLNGSKNQLALNLAISSIILNTEGVLTMVQLSVNLNHVTRNFSVSYTVNTIFGTVQQTLQTNFLLTEDGETITTEAGEGIII
jgi:hypothetical protein